MKWLRAVGLALLVVPIYAASWLMTMALLRNTWGWTQFEDGLAIGVLIGGFDLVRRSRRPGAARQRRLARYVVTGTVPTDAAELARLRRHADRERQHWHPFWLTALFFGGVVGAGFLGAALAGGRPRLWGAVLLSVWCAAGLAVELVGLARLTRMERLLAADEPVEVLI
jgi:uncharacterized membrane protein YoaK (UPF0700 family)